MHAPYVICCEPRYFDVVEGDNGYQPEGRRKWLENPEHWKARLLKTWHSVAFELERRGVTLIRVQPQADLPDQAFAADQVVVVMKEHGPRYVIPSNMNSSNRQREVALTVEALKSNQFANWGGDVKVDYIKHEGTGDFLYLPGHDFYVQGYGPRSQSGIGIVLSAAVNQLVAEVPLQVEAGGEGEGLVSKETKGFHLDTIVLPLPGKRIVACFERMAPQTRAFFEALYPAKDRISLTPEEADTFVTNSIVVPALAEDGSKNGQTIFIPDTTPRAIRNKLKAWGFGLKAFDFEPSKLSGGGLHCMFNFVFKCNEGDSKAVTVYDGPNGEGTESWPDVMKPLPPNLRAAIKWRSMRERWEYAPIAA